MQNITKARKETKNSDHQQRGINAREERQRAPDFGNRRDGIGGPHDAVDDPWLTPGLGHDPSGLERDEPEWGTSGEPQKQPTRERCVDAERAAPPSRQPVPDRDDYRDHAGADHDLKGEMADEHVGPLVARKLIQSGNLGVGVALGKNAERTGNLERVGRFAALDVGNAADTKRRAALGDELPFHRGKLGWLVIVCTLGQQVTDQRLEDGCAAGDDHRDRHAEPLIARTARTATAPERPGVCACGGEASGLVRGKRGVRRHQRPCWIREHGPRVDVGRQSVGAGTEPNRLLHPRIRGQDEDARHHAAYRDGPAAEPVRARGETLPSIEVEAEEDGLDEEGVPLEREGRSDQRSRHCHESRPEESELER